MLWDDSEKEGDDVVFRCSAFALGCGIVVAAAAAFGCADKVLMLFAPELSWLLLVPAIFIALLGAVGLCGSYRPASTLFRAQLAVFLLVLSTMLAGAGFFAFVSADATAQWILDGCNGYITRGSWSDAGRVEEKMRTLHRQYDLLRGAWETCRSFNPLVYDLAECGVRAECSDGTLAQAVPSHDWFQHVQVSFACGGFCTDTVPIFGLSRMADTLSPQSSCASKLSESVHSLGHIFGITAVLVAAPVAAIAIGLFVAAGSSGNEYEEIEFSDPDEQYAEVDSLTGSYRR